MEKLSSAAWLALFLAPLISFFLLLARYRRIKLHLKEIKKGADHFAKGDLGFRIFVLHGGELDDLANAMNQMAAELDERMRTVVRQRTEQDAVLSSMVEGVIAVDADERIIKINDAARELLNVSHRAIEGSSIQEIVRNASLQKFIQRALKSEVILEEDLIFRDEAERFFEVYGRPLRDANAKAIGVLIVINDVTKLRQLESLRRDFVANVSHEIKTPVTSIKGFVETLLDGAMQNPEDAKRFLGIIARQADRLNSIFEDLLSLSWIEQGTERNEIPLTQERLKPILSSAIQTCEFKASERAIALSLDCSADITCNINAGLLEQAIVNLIDNAIEYSEKGTKVEILVTAETGSPVIHVRDYGCGIEKTHLPRLFERFYRIDRGRSRKLGGTGLGLAIVKHIAQLHGGHVSVESTPGRGSTFSIHLGS